MLYKVQSFAWSFVLVVFSQVVVVIACRLKQISSGKAAIAKPYQQLHLSLIIPEQNIPVNVMETSTVTSVMEFSCSRIIVREGILSQGRNLPIQGDLANAVYRLNDLRCVSVPTILSDISLGVSASQRT